VTHRLVLRLDLLEGLDWGASLIARHQRSHRSDNNMMKRAKCDSSMDASLDARTRIIVYLVMLIHAILVNISDGSVAPPLGGDGHQR